MADEIVIGKLIIDNTDLQRAMVESKQSIVELENEQKKLKKETDNLTNATTDQLQAFVQNENALKRARAEYAANQKTVLEVTKAQLGLDAALALNVKTQDEAIANTKALTEARRKIDTTTVEGARAIQDINAKIDSNNALIKDSSSALEQQKANVGNYPQLMTSVGNAFGGATQQAIGFVQQGKEIISSFSEVAGSLTASAQGVLGFGNATNRAKEQAQGLTTIQGGLADSAEAVGSGSAGAAGGVNTLTKASLAFIATPIGLVLVAIALVLGTLIGVFKTFTPLVDKVEQGVAALSAAFNVVKNAIVAVVTGAKSLGEAFSSLGSDMGDAAQRAADLTKAQQDLDDVMKAQEVTSAKNRAEINKLNVELKNRTKTDQERLKIAAEIVKREEEDFKQRKAIVDEEVRIAREAIAIKAQFTKEEIKQLKETGDATKELAESRGGSYDEEYEALNKARLKAIALEDEVTVNIEKAYNRRDKIEDDARAKREARETKARADAEKALQADLKNARNRIDIARLEAEASNKTTEQRIADLQRFFDLEQALAKKELSGSDLKKAQLENRKELSTETLAIVEDQIQKELDAQRKSFEALGSLTQQQYDEQVQSATDLAQAQILLLDKQLLSERAYAEAVEEINNEKLATLATSYAAFEEGEKVRQETALANERALEEVAFQMRLLSIEERDAIEQELKAELLAAEYERDLQLLDQSLNDKLISEELYLEKRRLAEQKYNAEVKKNDKALLDQKRANNIKMANDAIGALQSLFGDSKELAIASALMNTYEGITAALKAPTLGQRIAGVSFATVTGFAAVRNILKTDKGGGGSGSLSSAGSTATSGPSDFVNSAQTTTVATVSNAPVEQNTVVTPPVLILETLAEAQGNMLVKINSD